MKSKTFTSQKGCFRLTLPVEWDESNDGEENTYSFFNSKYWTGNLRITPFRWTQLADQNEDKAAEFISDELSENIGGG